MINTQEEHLAKVHSHNYAYNTMAKHLMLNEKPSKWFFSRTKVFNNARLEALIDRNRDLQLGSLGIIAVAEQYYRDLYDTKPSNDAARQEILSSLTEKISLEAVQKLSAPMSISELEAPFQCAALGKSPGNNNKTTSHTLKATQRQTTPATY